MIILLPAPSRFVIVNAMGVFSKAKAVCTQLSSMRDFSLSIQAVERDARQLAQCTERDPKHRGPAEKLRIEGIFQAIAGHKLWLYAHTNCAEKAGVHKDAYFNVAVVAQELDRLQTLTFSDWQPTTGGGLEKRIEDPDDFRTVGNTLGLVLDGYGAKNYTPPPENNGILAISDPASVKLLERIIAEEQGRGR